jgi:hypothetical protein
MLDRAEHRETLMWCRHDPPRDDLRVPVSGPHGLRSGEIA